MQRTPIYTPKGRFLPVIQRPDNKQNREDGVLLPLDVVTVDLVAAAFRNVLIVVDGGGGVPMTGIYGDITLDFDCEIIGWTLLGREAGSLQLDLWKVPFAAFPPTVANTITGSAPPVLSSSDHNQSTALTGWTTGFSAGDCLRVNIDSVATLTRATLALHISG